MEVPSKCDKRQEESIQKNVCLLCKELRDFSNDFQALIKNQKKEAEKLWILVVRYNAILKGTKDEKIYCQDLVEAMKTEIVLDIQNRTTSILEAIQSSTSKLENLQKIYKNLEKDSSKLNWNDKKSSLVNGSVNHLSLNKILESSNDILFQFSVSLTCMDQYFNRLSLRDPETYEFLMNSMIISKDLLQFLEEFLALNRDFLSNKTS